MFNSIKILLFATIATLTLSCLKQTETISPIAEVRTLAQLQRESMINTALKAAGNSELSAETKSNMTIDPRDPTLFYLNLNYNIINMDLYENSNTQNSFEHIGNSLLKVFAKVFIRLTGDRTIHIGNVDLTIPDLNLDFGIIKTIKVKKLFIEYNKDYDASTGNRANFSFIKAFNLSKINGQNPLLISYDKKQNNCRQKCLNFDIQNGDIFDLLKNSKTILFKPLLKISSLPAVNELKLDGKIDMQIGLKLPF